MSAAGKNSAANSIQLEQEFDRSLDQSGIYEMGMGVQSIGKVTVNKMQFMPTKLQKTSAIHAIGIKAASSTVGGTMKKSLNEQNTIIVRDNERKAGSTSERGSMEKRHEKGR